MPVLAILARWDPMLLAVLHASPRLRGEDEGEGQFFKKMMI